MVKSRFGVLLQPLRRKFENLERKVPFYLIFAIVLAIGCQQKPTKVIEETVNPFENNIIFVDVRNDLKSQTAPLSGAIALHSEDFLILENPNSKAKKRKLDPDHIQIIERLANKGLSPVKRIILVHDQATLTEAKKMKWLLRQLELEVIDVITEVDARKRLGVRKSAQPESLSPWSLKSSEDLIKEFMYKKSKDCFVGWSDLKCKN